MRLEKTIINKNNSLMGFWVSGSEEAFGGISKTNIVSKAIKLDDLVKHGFNNNQVHVINGRIIPKGDFRINELPMTMYDETLNRFQDMDNVINLVGRILKDDTIVGFNVNIGGNIFSYKYDDVIRLTSWFKPGNFVVKTSENKKVFISGKPGILKLEELPEITVGCAVSRSKDKKLINNTSKSRIESKVIYNEKDIITLYSIVREFDGVIIKLPSDKYKLTTKTTKKVYDEFRELGIGEIGSPYVQFGESKLNANTSFKKIGILTVPISGAAPFPVYTFVWSTKTVFRNCENHMKRIAIAINKDGVNKIMSEFESTLGVKPINDENVIKPISQILGKNGLIFFEVDISKLSVISPDRAHQFILNNRSIKDTVIELMKAKAHNKYCNGQLKEIDDKAKSLNIYLDDGRKPFGLYAGLSPNYLKALIDAGINIFDGSYSKYSDVEPEDVDESDATDSNSDKDITIEYFVRGADISKLTYKSIVEKKSHPMYDSDLLKFVNAVEAIDNLKDRFNTVLEYKNNIEKIMQKAKEKLWLHKVSMISCGNGSVHSHDRSLWVQNVKSRAKGNVYDCVEQGCDGLYVIMNGLYI